MQKSKIILNQPISSKEEDWIGVSTYVDKLEAAIQNDAKMIAVTSDFGSGKSSLIAMLKKRYHWWKPCLYSTTVLSINLWSNLGVSDKKKENRHNEVEDDNVLEEKSNSIELHKAFLFHLISRISPRKGSYLSKRLSKNYGLFKIQSNSIINTIMVVLGFLFFMLGLLVRQFGTEFSKIIPEFHDYESIAKYIFFFIGIGIVLLVACKADFLFSSVKSEGNRELDENILIDYYNQEILFHRFFRHYVFVLEDIDRTNDIDSVVDFLKEIRKYYLMVGSIRGFIHHNKVTFVVNIKPEALLSCNNSRYDTSREKLYPKFFDYIIELRKINIDNYDAILTGLLNEIRDELEQNGLIERGEVVSIRKISGMQWIIRGEALDIREIKERLNKSLTLYESLINKFGNMRSVITFEKCAVAIYISNEYAFDFHQMQDRDFESLVEKSIVGNLDDEIGEWPESWSYLGNKFKKEIIMLIQQKFIDTNYRLYFFNYPKESKLYNMSEMMVRNNILYDEKPNDVEEFLSHLGETPSKTIIESMDKVVQLGLNLPKITLEYEKIFLLAKENFQEKLFELIQTLNYKRNGFEKTLKIIEHFILYGTNEENTDKQFYDKIAKIWNESIEETTNFLALRKVLCKVMHGKIILYKSLYTNNNRFITVDEINMLNNCDSVLELVNYQNIEDNLESCNLIAKIINEVAEKPEEKTLQFFLNYCKAYDINNTYNFIKEYCGKIKAIPESLNTLLLNFINEEKITPQDYINIIKQWSVYDEIILDSLDKMQWYFGDIEQAYEQLYCAQHYFCFVCNMISDEKEINFGDENIVSPIIENSNLLYNYFPEIWFKLRECITRDEKNLPQYYTMFSDPYPLLSDEEIKNINDLNIVIELLEINIIKEKSIDYIAEYFGSRFRNSSQTFSILSFITRINDTKLAKLLFYSLDMDNIRYRLMSTARKKKINDEMFLVAET